MSVKPEPLKGKTKSDHMWEPMFTKEDVERAVQYFENKIAEIVFLPKEHTLSRTHKKIRVLALLRDAFPDIYEKKKRRI